MDYKKAYNKALERAREFYNSKDSSATMKLVSLNIFPELVELRESEDERIRVRDFMMKQFFRPISPDLADALADAIIEVEKTVLNKKQKEQKPAECDEEERRRRMCIAAVNIAASAKGGLLHSEASECLAWLEEQKDKNCLACDQHLMGYIAGRKVTEEEKQKEKAMDESDKIAAAYQLGRSDERKQKEQKPVEHLSVRDEFDLDGNPKQKPVEKQDYSGLNDLERAILRGFLCAGVENVPVTIIKETAQDCLAQVKPVEWSEKHIADVFEKVGLSKIVREQGNDELTNAVQSAMIELSKGNSKEWSEENEAMRDNILRVLQCFVGTSECETNPSLSTTYPLYQREMDWLKSLRPQKKEDLPKWKPSEEQMKALELVVNFLKPRKDTYEPKKVNALESLYNDLKKLMED